MERGPGIVTEAKPSVGQAGPGAVLRRRGSGSLGLSEILVPGVNLVLHEGEVTVHLVPEGGLRQAAVGVDGVNLGHF